MKEKARRMKRDVLRDYQRQAVRATLAKWDRVRSLLFICPTGGGKTHVFAELARLTKGRTLILTDRRLLAKQIAEKIETLTGLTVGLEQGWRRIGHKVPEVVVATVQSISKPDRLRRFKPGTFALIVVDEADLGITPSYRAVVDYFAAPRVFGCTATPDRADGRTLGEVFQEIAATVNMMDLIEQGHRAGGGQRGDRAAPVPGAGGCARAVLLHLSATREGRVTRKQCAKCPWKKGVNPHEIPNGYDPEKHAALAGTIAEPGAVRLGGLRVFACHETPVGRELPCVGWLMNQLGPGNNLGLRLAVSMGRIDAEVQTVGPQHETFEDTLPKDAAPRAQRARR